MRHATLVDPSGLMSVRIDVYELPRAYMYIVQAVGLLSVCYSGPKNSKDFNTNWSLCLVTRAEQASIAR